MKPRLTRARTLPYPLLLVPAVLGMALVSCGECLTSCPLGMAVIVRVTAPPAGGPVNGAFIQVSGAITNPCTPQADASVCNVPGPAGRYELEVGAPGFQTTHRTVTVHGTSSGRCGCEIATTEYLTIVLVAST